MNNKNNNRYLLVLMLKPSTTTHLQGLLATMLKNTLNTYHFKLDGEINYAGVKKIYTDSVNLSEAFCVQFYIKHQEGKEGELNNKALDIQKVKDAFKLNTSLLTYYFSKVTHSELLFNSFKRLSNMTFFVKPPKNTTENSEEQEAN